MNFKNPHASSLMAERKKSCFLKLFYKIKQHGIFNHAPHQVLFRSPSRWVMGSSLVPWTSVLPVMSTSRKLILVSNPDSALKQPRARNRNVYWCTSARLCGKKPAWPAKNSPPQQFSEAVTAKFSLYHLLSGEWHIFPLCSVVFTLEVNSFGKMLMLTTVFNWDPSTIPQNCKVKLYYWCKLASNI